MAGRFFIYSYVNDLSVMRDFYSGVLGLDEIFYEAGPSGGLAYVHGGVQLTFFVGTIPQAHCEGWTRQPGWPGGTREVVSWSIQVESREQFERTVEKARTLDCPRFHDHPEWRGYWSYPLRDPMGNTIEISWEGSEDSVFR